VRRVGLRAKLAALAPLLVLPLFSLFFPLLLGGCTVGNGNGSAIGPIYLLGCSEDSNYGTKEMPKIFNLDPSFFAGEPIEDIAVALPMNHLVIRMQRNGNRIEVNDTLYIDVQDAYEVARCVRGRTVGGVPDWDQRMTTSTYTIQPTTTPWCDWSGTASPPADGGVDGGADGGLGDGGVDAGPPPPAGHARIHLGTEEFIRSSLSLLFTCHQATVVGVAFDGWIDFLDFGPAAQPDLLPEDRAMIERNFKVNFGDRLRANFHIVLNDERIVASIKALMPPPAPKIGGTLDGFFDFDLERGRGAQPFP
jgi:hypothetical protein